MKRPVSVAGTGDVSALIRRQPKNAHCAARTLSVRRTCITALHTRVLLKCIEGSPEAFSVKSLLSHSYLITQESPFLQTLDQRKDQPTVISAADAAAARSAPTTATSSSSACARSSSVRSNLIRGCLIERVHHQDEATSNITYWLQAA